jgi:hypothetical protein
MEQSTRHAKEQRATARARRGRRRARAILVETANAGPLGSCARMEARRQLITQAPRPGLQALR